MLPLMIMRRLDSWLGWPAATLLGLWPHRRQPVPATPRAIVVVKLSGLGSLLVCAAVFRALRAAQPQARLFVVAFDGTVIIETDDTTLAGPGQVGLWTKADSVSAFDDLKIK